MDGAGLVLGGAVLVLSVALLLVLALVKSRLPALTPAHGPESEAEVLATNAAGELDIREAAGPEPALEVWTAELDDYLFRIERAEELPVVDEDGLPAWVPRVVESVLAHAPRTSTLVTGDNAYLVRFPQHVAEGLKNGTLQLAKSGGEQLTTAVSTSTGQIAGHGRVVGHVGAGSGAALTVAGLSVASLGVAAVAAGAAYLHQRWLQQSLKAIDSKVVAIADRLRDDDHGRLEAAVHVAESVDRVLREGRLPAHYQVQLATATIDTHALYRSRRRYLRRFSVRLEEAQSAHEERTGSPAAWAKGATDAFGDAAQFRAETLVYLHALVVRARLGATAAGALATDGYGVEALRELDRTLDELHSDFSHLQRRMRALANAESTPRGREGKGHLRTARDLSELMAAEVAPALPARMAGDVVVPVGRLPAMAQAVG